MYLAKTEQTINNRFNCVSSSEGALQHKNNFRARGNEMCEHKR